MVPTVFRQFLESAWLDGTSLRLKVSSTLNAKGTLQKPCHREDALITRNLALNKSKKYLSRLCSLAPVTTTRESSLEKVESSCLILRVPKTKHRPWHPEDVQ